MIRVNGKTFTGERTHDLIQRLFLIVLPIRYDGDRPLHVQFLLNIFKTAADGLRTRYDAAGDKRERLWP